MKKNPPKDGTVTLAAGTRGHPRLRSKSQMDKVEPARSVISKRKSDRGKKRPFV